MAWCTRGFRLLLGGFRLLLGMSTFPGDNVQIQMAKRECLRIHVSIDLFIFKWEWSEFEAPVTCEDRAYAIPPGDMRRSEIQQLASSPSHVSTSRADARSALPPPTLCPGVQATKYLPGRLWPVALTCGTK